LTATCTLCGDSGYVAVPHPVYVVMGEWTHATHGRTKPTAAVTCCCMAGGRLAAAQESKRQPPMTLVEYEARIPRDLWQALLDEEWQRIKREAAERAERESATLPPIAKREEAPLEDPPF